MGLKKQQIELTAPLAFLLLHELRTASSGTELAKKLGERRGSGMITPGTIYPALKELRRKKLVSYRTSGREKIYSLTVTGQQELDQLYKDFSRLFKGLRHKIRPIK